MENYSGSVGNEAKLEFYETFIHLPLFTQRNRAENLEDTPNVLYLEEINKQKLCPEPFGIVRRKGPSNQLDIHEFGMGDEYAKAFSEAIGIVKDIQTLNLRANRLTDKGVVNILAKLTSANIKSIVLSENRLGFKSVECLGRVLYSVDCQIKILELENIHLGERELSSLIRSISENKTVTKLCLAKNNIGEGCGSALKDLLRYNSVIKYLDLHWNVLGKGGLADFCEGLTENESLRHLDLSWNSLGRSSSLLNAKSLSRCLSGQQSLQHLDLSNNYFNQKECEILGDGLKVNKKIYGIHVQGNDCEIDAKGYIIPVEYSNKTEQGHLHTRIMETPRFKPHKLARLNCWVCEKWVQATFSWRPGTSGPKLDSPFYVHLECDNYKPTPAEKNEDDTYTITRMVPAGNVRFFFRSGTRLLSSKEYPTQTVLNPVRFELSATDGRRPSVSIHSVNSLFVEPQEWDFKKVTVKPRSDLKVKEWTEVILEKIIWNFETSVFKGYQFDNQEIMAKCCSYDIDVSHIKDIISDPGELAEVTKMLEINYKTITEAFRHLSGLSGIELFAISKNILGDFLRKCGLLANDYNLSDVAILWNLSNAPQSKGEIFNSGNGLCRYEFSEFLIRLAIDKFFKSKQAKSVLEAFEMLLHQYIIPVVKTFDTNSWRSQFYLLEDVDCVLKAYKPILESIFVKYSAMGKGALDKMNLSEFRILCGEAGLMKGSFVVRDIDWCFRQAMMTEVDEVLAGEHLEMIYVEFIEALSRVADFLYPTSEQHPSLDKKLESLMPALINLAPENVSKFFETPTEETYLNMKYSKKFVQRQEVVQ
jgi:Ran GTPase-activating protein (RanGAP) involved in mRNA processing and transport